MNLEGYGPIATGMGGASMAYDNGTAAMMNNPATLSLMEGPARLDVAVGVLGPDITTKYSGMPDANSSADMFLMPAFGYVRKTGSYTYGVGIFAQGGMGTEYAPNSIMDGFVSMITGTAPPNMGNAGLQTRSEVSVGRLLLPLSYEVDRNLSIGGSLDFVWAGMDLQMLMGGEQMRDMIAAFGGSERYGTLGGSMISTLGSFVGGAGPLDADSPVNWGFFNFTNESDYTGKAKATGFAGKIGAVYKASEQLTIGAAYHSKTALGDLETSGASLKFNVNQNDGDANGTVGPAMEATVNGKITVKDFQWPQMLGLGTAYQATPRFLVVFDYKWINWKDVLKDFTMTFTAENDTFGNAFAGTALDATLFQNWKDQHVFMIGAAHKTTDQLTLRAGLNIANNPIPSEFENPLFPATIKTHVTLGAGYDIDRDNKVNASFTYAPEIDVTNGSQVTTTHSQMNYQIMYSHLF